MALIAAACGSGADSGTSTGSASPTSGPVSTAPSEDGNAPTPAVSALPAGPSALEDRHAVEFPEPLIPPDDIISGGPPPDGIPPIDEPAFLTVAEHLDLLAPDEPVVALDIEGDARAYPVRILIWHEIVNDTVGGVPVAVTYCPLCNSAATYVRTIDGFETTFGTSGSLFASALVMYDRATESLWTHFDGRAVVGLLAGAELASVPSPLMAWSDFVVAYPDGMVLDERRTGHNRRYGSNPYVGYDDPDTRPFLFIGDADERARAKQRVVGVELNGDAQAFTLDLLRGAGDVAALNTRVGGEPLVILWKSGQSSALQTAELTGADDVGSVGVFRADVDGTTAEFSVDGDEIRDAATGSTWNVAGQAIAGPASGTSLERVPHLDTFWFAWSTYRPGTALVEAE